MHKDVFRDIYSSGYTQRYVHTMTSVLRGVYTCKHANRLNSTEVPLKMLGSAQVMFLS